MPRAPRQQRAKSTVEAILDAGYISLGRHGLAGTTTTHIADIAGVSVGSLYEYFRTKEAIYAAMQERFVRDLVSTLQPLTPKIVRKPSCGPNPWARPEPISASTVTTIPREKSRRLPAR